MNDWQNWIVDIEIVTPDYIIEGTGALVGPNDVLTNAHVILDGSYSLDEVTINLYFGGIGSGFDTYGTSVQYYDLDVFYGDTLTINYAQYDLGLITLADNIGDELGWFEIAYNSSSKTNFLNVAGFPGTPYSGDTLYSDYIFADYDNYYNTITYSWPEGTPGSSGSPLWSEDDDGNLNIVGLNTLRSFDDTQNTASSFTEETYNTIQSWITDNDPAPVEPVIIDDDNSFWNARIQNKDTYISASEAQLYRIYYGAMGRLPDEDGYDWWLNQIESGDKGLLDVAAGFIWSEEFHGYADENDDGHITNEEFLSHMYLNVFEREPDAEGYAWWLDQLDSEDKNQVISLVEMTQSNEYVELTLTIVAEFDFLV
ncbi:MAG: DUF4214 domain-containing protein [Neptuniibacter sp.]